MTSHFLKNIQKDILENKKNTKGLLVVIFFRIASFFYIKKKQNILLYLIGSPFILSYKLVIEWLLCIELQLGTSADCGLSIYHGQGLVVHKKSKLGEYVILRHNTTIGNRQLAIGAYSDCPVIGNNVDIGSNSVIIGAINIGNNSIIGAGSVVTKDIPDNSVVAGNPARIIRQAVTE